MNLQEKITKVKGILQKSSIEGHQSAKVAHDVIDEMQVVTYYDELGVVKETKVNASPAAPALTQQQKKLAAFIDHTQLKPEATRAQVIKLCLEARRFQFASVCVNPANAVLCASLLSGSGVKVGCTVGFPLGAATPEIKRLETIQAIKDGASEVDMVINIGALKDGDLALVVNDILGIVEAAHERSALIKVIIETCLLTDDEKRIACLLARQAGADFVKTSTGFSSAGATPQDVALMRAVVGADMGVKAAGGIRTLEDMQKMLQAGATRIGTSAGVRILTENITPSENLTASAY